MNLAAALVAAWVAIAHPHPSSTEEARFFEASEGIAFAAHHHPLSSGERKTVALLGAIAEHEGHLHEDVRRCQTTGDHGRAFSLFQLHEEGMGDVTPEEVCASDKTAALVALSYLHAGEHACSGDLKCAVRLYASGKKRDTKAAREIWSTYRRILRALPKVSPP